MIKHNQRRAITAWHAVMEHYQRRSGSKDSHCPWRTLYTCSDRQNHRHEHKHYPRHDRSNQYIQSSNNGSQVTHKYHHKTCGAQHCYHHTYTRDSLSMPAEINQDASQRSVRSENQSSVTQSAISTEESSSQQKVLTNLSVDNKSPGSSNDSSASPSTGEYVAPNASQRRGEVDSRSSWRQPIEPVRQSHIPEDNSTVNRPASGRQRNQRSSYVPPGQRRQPSHGWRQSSGNHRRYQQPSQPKPVKPSEQYMALSQQPSVLLEEPVPKKLLILDLNGTLASRTKKRDSMYVRPYQDKFVDYIFRYFDVMVWSSAQPHSVAHMCRLFEDRVSELILKWDRTMLGLTPAQYNSKSVTIKDLEKVWKALDSKYDATNTILLDDSPIKAQLQPYNSIHLREFSHTSPTFHSHGESELLHVLRYLETVRLQSNVCSFMKDAPFVPPDPTQDEHNENMFEVYHYVFNKEGRELANFQRKEDDDGEVAQVQQLLENTRI